MEINCSHLGCSITPAYKCLCINESPVFCESHLREHIACVNKRHIVEKYKILSQEEIANIRIAELKALCKNINSLKAALLAKEENLFAPKIKKFLNSIDSDLESIDEIIDYLNSDEDATFYEKFESTYEETLSKYQEELNSLEEEINRIEDIRFFTAEEAWAHQISEEEKDSDYKKLRTEIKPFKFDELYAYTILWYLDNYAGDMHVNEFFDTTNFCDKEKILIKVAENLNKKCENALYQIIDKTRINKAFAQSGSNAMSILVKKKIDFEGKDFSGVNISYANLSYGIFYKTNFSDSDLSHCNLFCAQFLNADTSKIILPISYQNSESKEKIDRINSLAFSHDGSWIAVCQNQKVKLYDSYNSKFKKEFYAENAVLCLQVVSWSFGDSFIASSDFNRNIYIWNSWDENSKLENSFIFGEGIAKSIWSPNDDRIAAYSSYGNIKVWSYKTGEVCFELDAKLSISMLLWSPSGKYLTYYCANEFICIYNSITSQLIASHRHSDIYSLEWIFEGEEGNYLVFGGKGPSITIWNISTDKTHDFSNGSNSHIRVLKWNKKLSLLAAGTIEGSINIWSVYKNDDKDHPFSYDFEIIICCHLNDVECLGWAEKNNLLASGGSDGTIKMWKIKTKHIGHNDKDTEETKSRGYSDNESEKIEFKEVLLWCTEASHFIKAELIVQDLYIHKATNKTITF